MMDWFAEKYFGPLTMALQRAGGLAWLLATEWLLYPVALATVVHPGDAVGFLNWMQGQPVPGVFTTQQLAAGEIAALVALAALNLLLLGTVVLVYRRANFYVAMWPVAAALVGVVGNGMWFAGKGHFDFSGAVMGLLPLAAMIVCEKVCEKMGADFVFGQGVRPEYSPAAPQFDPWGENNSNG